MRSFIAAALAAFLSVSLAGCVISQPGKPDVRVNLPKAPEHYLACFKQLVGKPVGQMTREKVVRLIAELKASDKRKSACGEDVLDWYARVRLEFGKA